MIRHCVMLRLKPDVDRGALETLSGKLRNLVARLDGCSGYTAGPNRDFEGKSPGYAYGFTLDARDETALDGYAQHPDHKAIGAQLVDMCIGGADGIAVYDLEETA